MLYLTKIIILRGINLLGHLNNMCFDSIKIFIYIDEVILIIIMADEKLVPKLRFGEFTDGMAFRKI